MFLYGLKNAFFDGARNSLLILSILFFATLKKLRCQAERFCVNSIACPSGYTQNVPDVFDAFAVYVVIVKHELFASVWHGVDQRTDLVHPRSPKALASLQNVLTFAGIAKCVCALSLKPPEIKHISYKQYQGNQNDNHCQ